MQRTLKTFSCLTYAARADYHEFNVTALGEKENSKQQQEHLEEAERRLYGEQQFRALGNFGSTPRGPGMYGDKKEVKEEASRLVQHQYAHGHLQEDTHQHWLSHGNYTQFNVTGIYNRRLSNKNHQFRDLTESGVKQYA